jgi:hypothetical protein
MTLPKKGDRILAVNVGLFGTVVARGVGFNYSLTVHWDGDREPSTNAEGAKLLSRGIDPCDICNGTCKNPREHSR